MPPLFFALAAASSGTSGSIVGGQSDRLALLPGSPGWQSSRCCRYPQELLLELERSAEVSEIEVATSGDLSPKAVDIYLSCNKSGSDSTEFELAGTLQFDPEGFRNSSVTSGRASLAKRARLKIYATCSGQVKLLVHEPVSSSRAGNPFGQVALSNVEIWGSEDAACSRAKPARQWLSNSIAKPEAAGNHGGLSGDAGEVERVLTELDTEAADGFSGDVGDVTNVLLDLGIPLDVVPVDEAGYRFTEVDPTTRRLLLELQQRQSALLKAAEFGQAQRLAEHMEHLQTVGTELRKLQLEQERCAGAGSLEDARKIHAPMQKLSESRLNIAALYETDFWAEQMAAGLSRNPGSVAADIAHSLEPTPGGVA